MTDLVALGVRLGWVGVDDKEEPALDAVMERLRPEGEGILNAIDANEIKPYLPRGGAARVLITSNARPNRMASTMVSSMEFAKSIDNAGIINAKLAEAMGFAI